MPSLVLLTLPNLVAELDCLGRKMIVVHDLAGVRAACEHSELLRVVVDARQPNLETIVADVTRLVRAMDLDMVVTKDPCRVVGRMLDAARYRSLLDAAPVMLHSLDDDGKIDSVSEHWLQRLGLRRDEVIGRPSMDLADPSERQHMLEEVLPGLTERGHTDLLPLTFRDTSGNPVEVLASAVRVRGPVGMISLAVLQDITELVHGVDSIKTERAQLERLADALPFLVAYVDQEERYRFINDAYHTVLGWNRADVVGKHLLELMPPQAYEAIRNNVAKALGGEKVDFEVASVVEGKPMVFSGIYLPHRGVDGEVLGFHAVLQDLTETRELERRDRERRADEEKRRRLESLGLLAGGVAHDFNNLLTGIQSNAEVVLMAMDAVHPLRGAMVDLQMASRRAAELTAQLLAFSGRAEFAGEPVEIGDMVREMGRLLAGGLGPDCQLVLECELQDLWVRASATQLRQVVMNLITNAADAIDDSPGTVVVSTGVCEHQPPGKDVDEYVWFQVEDDGCGMDEAHASRIFEPFFTTRSDGNGLGLSAVQGIVRGHGGELELSSEPTRGTRVRVWLPAAEAPSLLPFAGDMRSSVDGRSGAVLVVDDQPLVARAASRMLERCGFDVTVALGGLEGLELFSQRADDWGFVLVDVSMPGLDGPALVLRMRERRPELKAVLMSGYSEERVDQDITLAPVWFLQKPLSVSLVNDVLAEMFGTQG
ncbi:MAG: two-component system cell cycle sensor histidine kinase/response regulator CckA [Kiritimatiellia bacterium]|jgi:two-component system cell cycle sensor histidine kinase/response regulator CckA